MAMSNLPAISVVIATLNSAATLQRAIDSVAQQSYRNKELIIIDGDSSDGTAALIRQNKSSVTSWISEPDRSNYEALNKGVLKATGEWIYILGADDYLWSPDTLRQMAPHLAHATPTVRVVYGRVAYVNAAEEVLHMIGEPWESARLRFRDRMTLPHQGVFHHRSLFEVHGLFNESFRMAGDYELLLRELKSGTAIHVSEVIVAGYQHGGGSSAPGNAPKVLLEYRKAQRLNGFAQPSLYWLYCYIRTWGRMVMWKALGPQKAARFDDWLRNLFGLPKIWTRI